MEGKVGDFLKRVESLGREQSFTEYYDEDNTSFASFYNMETEQRYRYRFTVGRPENMKIVYALTQDQYQALLNENDYGDLYAGIFPNYKSNWEDSYYRAGIYEALTGFFLFSIALGSGCVWILGRHGQKDYCYQELKICRFPLEVNLLFLFFGFAMVENLLSLICSCLLYTSTAAIAEAFNTRELIKISVLKNCFDDPRQIAQMVAERTHSTVVQVIGKKFVLYKENKDHKKIELPQ